MGLRFRRSIKIAKGLRLNVSGSGISLSVGGRGATVNVSARGTRTTLGIPGTGVSWTSTSSRARPQSAQAGSAATRATARVPSAAAVARELDALRRELRQQAAADAEERDEENLSAIVNWWRRLAIAPPDPSFYQEALKLRASDGNVAKPARPVPPVEVPRSEPSLDIEAEERRFLADVDVKVDRNVPPANASQTLVVGSTAAAGAAFGISALVGVPILTAACISPLFGVLPFALIDARRRGRNAHARESGRARYLAEWPRIEEEVQNTHRANVEALRADHALQRARTEESYRSALEAYESAANAIEAEWQAQERQRVELLARLIAGEPEVSTKLLAEFIEDIEFPFETDVDFSLSLDGKRVQLLVDLPEIEDSIPETRVKAFKNGNTKDVKRTATERFGKYAQLVTGLGISLAAQAFCVLPAVVTVGVAGYTQRRARGKGTLEDQFVYEVSILREDLYALDPEADDPLEVLAAFEECRFDFDARGNMKKITPPSWMLDVRDEM